MGLQGVQQLPPIFFIDKVGGRGDWGLEPFLRSMDALWLTILRRGTLWDSRALGKVLGPWQGLGWGKKAGWIGAGWLSWCRFVNTTAISFDISSRINHQLAADAETSTAL